MEGGNKQHETINKVEATSPTAALEYVLLIATIYSHKKRDVSKIDIPNVFVNTRLKYE